MLPRRQRRRHGLRSDRGITILAKIPACYRSSSIHSNTAAEVGCALHRRWRHAACRCQRSPLPQTPYDSDEALEIISNTSWSSTRSTAPISLRNRSADEIYDLFIDLDAQRPAVAHLFSKRKTRHRQDVSLEITSMSAPTLRNNNQYRPVYPEMQYMQMGSQPHYTQNTLPCWRQNQGDEKIRKLLGQ